jgi:hypothetical protein
MAPDEGVSLKEHFDALLAAERRLTEEKVKRLDQAVAAAESKAEAANDATTGLANKHNDLIRKGENDRADFATKDEVGLIRDEQSMLRSSLAKVAGAAAVLAVLVSFIIRLAGIG